jgi:hypothetical protein
MVEAILVSRYKSFCKILWQNSFYICSTEIYRSSWVLLTSPKLLYAHNFLLLNIMHLPTQIWSEVHTPPFTQSEFTTQPVKRKLKTFQLLIKNSSMAIADFLSSIWYLPRPSRKKNYLPRCRGHLPSSGRKNTQQENIPRKNNVCIVS